MPQTNFYREGEVHYTNEGYKVKIISYLSKGNCSVVFEDGFIISGLTYYCIKKGKVKNPYHRSCRDIGFLGVGSYNSSHPSHSKWCGIMARCYSDDLHLKRPKYKDCTVAEEWHNFQNFGKWFEENYNPETMQGWHLDKDILKKGNKIYSPETCCFVPQYINSIFVKTNTLRGIYPIGVLLDRGSFRSSLKIDQKILYLGYFKTPEEAFNAYKIGKEIHIKEVAEKWKDKIAENVYRAMINYKVEITD